MSHESWQASTMQTLSDACAKATGGGRDDTRNLKVSENAASILGQKGALK